jgi:hypothetical protein
MFFKCVFIFCWSWFASAIALADPVWHCSRSDLQVADASNNFSLAALDVERQVIHISLRDLYAIYQGAPVQVSGYRVSACFMSGNDATTLQAMKSLGVNMSTVQSLSRKSLISSNHLYTVRNEQEMTACLAKHHPAIGYLPQATHTEAAGPCF